jgi:hypothetical protein
MFYRPTEQLKAKLEERLRTALEFATLGTYEPDGQAPPAAPREPQTRVFLFAKVSPPCPHSPAPAATCDAAGAGTSEQWGVSVAGPLVGTRRRSRPSRRGGTAKPAPQPCTWSHGPRS